MWCLKPVVERIRVREMLVEDREESPQCNGLFVQVKFRNFVFHGYRFSIPKDNKYVSGVQLLLSMLSEVSKHERISGMQKNSQPEAIDAQRLS